MFVEFEPGEKFSYTNDNISDSHEAFQDAGWILEKDDYVIDIDKVPKEIIKKIIKEFDIKTQIVWTDRGCHLYFKKPDCFIKRNNMVSPLGFEYEIKHLGNAKAVTIKRNGILRQIENKGVREEAPFIFSSFKKYDVLLDMGEGDGRNNALFSLRGKILGVKEWKKILYFINKYIFAEPLGDKEMDTITRDIDFDSEKGKKFDLAGYLINELNFVQYANNYYFKYQNEYISNDNILKRIIYNMIPSKPTRTIDEVKKRMEYRCKIIPTDTVFNIKFNNGYLRDGEFVDIITDDFTPYQINIDYDEDAKAIKVVDDYIDHLTGGDKEYRLLLLEILGHCLIVDGEFKRMLGKFFIFIGGGGNGKGTLLQIISSILGDKNISAMSISELSDDRYLPSFKGKLANLGDDIQDQAINDRQMKILKNLSTCDRISTRELYKSPVDMSFTGTLIFTSNHILKSWEKGESYKRRVLWLPMYSKVEKKDPKFITKLTTDEALKYWVKLIVDGYKRLYKNKKFTECKIVNDFNNNYHVENNPALLYISDLNPEDFIDKPIKDVYDDYKRWCFDNDVNYNKNMIKQAIEEKFNLIGTGNKATKKINGKATKVFIKEDLLKI